MEKRLRLLLILVLAVADVFAEGSKELTASGGYRAFLYSGPAVNLSYPFPSLGTVKVYVKPGEIICAGSSAQGIGSGTINFRAPDGAAYTSGGGATTGRIANRSQEVAGPLPAAGGYTPYTLTVLAGQEGVWEIDFTSPTNVSGSNPVPILGSANWTQLTNQYVAAFDVSVRNAAGAFVPGRVYMNVFTGILGTYDVGFNAIFRILTRDGYQYTLDNNGQAGNGFSFFANNKGFRTPGGAASYKSVDNLALPNIQDPRALDTQSDITHKIFFNTPAADLPSSAKTPGGTTWLLTTPITPQTTNLTFKGGEGTPGKGGTSPIGGYIGFDANQNGTYVISIDLNNNGSFTDAIDRKLTGNSVAGNNQVPWDGLDGLGNKVAATGTSAVTAMISVVLFGGEVHFPFFDVERNINGLKLTRINGAGAPDNTLYWNDSPITVVGTPSNPLVNLTGLDSQLNGHKWGTAGAGATEFGDENGLDTWGYISSAPANLLVTGGLREADLEVASLDMSQDCTGKLVTYTATVKNNGPDEVTGATFSFTFPAGITGVAVTSAAISGTSSVNGPATGSGRYTTTVNLDNGATRSFTLTGVVPSAPAGSMISVSAGLLRTADVTDPDATNPDDAVPSDILAECNAAPSGAGCNNLKTVATAFLPTLDAGPDRTVARNTMVTMAASGTGTWTQSGASPISVAIADQANPATLISGFKLPGIYSFTWANTSGCTDTVRITVVSSADDETIIPTIFTPNGDGKNDTFEIPGLENYPGSMLHVFNRWGNEVYRSENYLNNWDGSDLAEGTYFYVLDRKAPAGTLKSFKGWVFIKR
ncbi:gliding motility-associated C-terminal domain-containing protein [Hufsiella ginkgonis]|uniref:T9SS type B sorting domain-containing protein n=1 Tax=Hufsiella ginkgonis TaxID=2695274 RepID=A0A7K1XTX5_9SPHI|nr:gliding motility-associated C-terminal domain-containing protein [Hufsiella ginkgonis]MXV14247.1 T9SS type B sorting domain-containing protein [Hufsiella ginkgonis]